MRVLKKISSANEKGNNDKLLKKLSKELFKGKFEKGIRMILEEKNFKGKIPIIIKLIKSMKPQIYEAPQ